MVQEKLLLFNGCSCDVENHPTHTFHIVYYPNSVTPKPVFQKIDVRVGTSFVFFFGHNFLPD